MFRSAYLSDVIYVNYKSKYKCNRVQTMLARSELKLVVWVLNNFNTLVLKLYQKMQSSFLETSDAPFVKKQSSLY